MQNEECKRQEEARVERGARWQRATRRKRVCHLAFCLLHFAFCILLLLCLAVPRAAQAHPVGLGIYERTIDVSVSQEAVTVTYRLELTETTAVKDLLDVGDGKELARLTRPQDYYEAFTRVYAPILAANLTARLDGKDLAFTCIQRSHQVLDHLRCDFVFQAQWTLRPEVLHEFTFREDNYDREAGMVRLALTGDPSIAIQQKTEPDAALKARTFSELKPGDEDRLRKLSATFRATRPGEESSMPVPPPPASAEASELHGEDSLLRLFLNSENGFWMVMLMAVLLGAAHAVTPGHGKTLVAAYLVGQRGTVWHALLLGLVTTLTHTGIVLVLAIALRLFYPDGLTAETQRNVDRALGLVGGLLIAGLGAWLLFRRLTGQADHFHLPGQGHHHHHHDHAHEHTHEHGDHGHDEHGHDHPRPERAGVGGLIVLGIQGGIVPCWDAVVLLLAAVAMNLLWLALPMLLAFSAGLAGVLIAIGIVVVKARHLAGAHLEQSRLFKALPLVSALVITCLGLWLCYDRLHPRPPSPSPPAHARP